MLPADRPLPGDRVVFGAAALPEPDRDWLAAAEKLPLASVWQGGHLLSPSPTGEAITRLAFLAAWTERLRIGTAVLLLPLYHPVVVAKQLADLDARSGGRVSVGIGVGGEFPAEFDAVGVPLAERGPRTDEAMEVLRLLWAGGQKTHHGKFFDLENVELRPVRTKNGNGMQQHGPPLIVSGRKAPAMRRAARLGDGWMPYLVSPEGNPALVYARCRPSRTAAGTVEDFGLLVEARAGFCTQLAGHRPGPIFTDVRAPGAGTALLLLTSVLALLGRRPGRGRAAGPRPRSTTGCWPRSAA